VTTTRELLLAERARARWQVTALEREFAGIADAAGEPGTDDEHDPEGATLAFERQHAAALLARALERIAEIDAAIGRLDDGTYGTCARCGQPVGEDRLAARPTAATCVRCARLPGPRSRVAMSLMGPGACSAAAAAPLAGRA
jgi:DnaK suppressor protein